MNTVNEVHHDRITVHHTKHFSWILDTFILRFLRLLLTSFCKDHLCQFLKYGGKIFAVALA